MLRITLITCSFAALVAVATPVRANPAVALGGSFLGATLGGYAYRYHHFVGFAAYHPGFARYYTGFSRYYPGFSRYHPTLRHDNLLLRHYAQTRGESFARGTRYTATRHYPSRHYPSRHYPTRHYSNRYTIRHYRYSPRY